MSLWSCLRHQLTRVQADSSERGSALLAPLVAVLLVLAGIGALFGAPNARPDPVAATTLPPTGDTVVVYGPRQLIGFKNKQQTYYETFTHVVAPTSRYLVRLSNGAPDGQSRVTSADVYVNGSVAVTLTSTDAEKTAIVAPTGLDTLRVRVTGGPAPASRYTS
jgi:hypothetical protein